MITNLDPSLTNLYHHWFGFCAFWYFCPWSSGWFIYNDPEIKLLHGWTITFLIKSLTIQDR